ncbi:hypothetical protein Salat_1970200 [Sesamum alatum]|uniref:Uncharacterized protein n=1 Tax=Sesamum alatum TaxID=300844 RepID=A0AAE2CIY3_9LAMI|nr:hypothetical protein Salat_1970200 [Sesamum alatum]
MEMVNDESGPNEETEEEKARPYSEKELEKKAYERGTYGRAIEFLEAALTIIPRPTLFGGEIQIWLAMAYEANNRHADCIALYQQLEKQHPSISIRRRLQNCATYCKHPSLRIQERCYAAAWTDKDKDKDQTWSGSLTNQLPSTKDYLVWKPPVGLEKNRTFWASIALWIGVVGAVLFLQR